MAAKKRKPPKKVYYSKTKSRPMKKILLRRVLVIGILASLVMALVLGLFFGFKYIGSFFLSRNPAFELKTIHITSDGRLSAEQLRDYSGVHTGTNIFCVNFDELREKFETLPSVETVKFSRKLPDTLNIYVTERTAIAQLRWSTRGLPFLLDRHGVVLPITDGGQSLPLIEGFKPEKLQPGDRITNPGISQCLKILVAVDELGLGARVSFSKFDIRYPDFVNTVVNNGVSVRFPQHSAHEKLARLVAVLQKAREEGRRIKTIDLTPDGRNVPVTYFE